MMARPVTMKKAAYVKVESKIQGTFTEEWMVTIRSADGWAHCIAVPKCNVFETLEAHNNVDDVNVQKQGPTEVGPAASSPKG